MAEKFHSGTQTLKNTSAVPLPVIALGTWEANPDNREQCEESVLAALQAGYRHIDTAALYQTEQAVGKAIKRSGIPREEIVVCTKFWNHYHDPKDLERSLDESLQRLGLQYIDLFLMHWPVAFKRTVDYEIARDGNDKPIVDHDLTANHEPTWRAMEALVDSGKARSIGVSNFTIPLLEKLLSYARIKPACNQVECHPYLPQNKLLEYCNKNQINLTAYSPLGSQVTAGSKKVVLRDDETITKAAEQLKCDPAQILIAWAVQRGTVPIPKSATPSRIETNFNVPVLPDDIFKEISDISFSDPSRHIRFVNFDETWGVKLFTGDSGQ